MENIFNFRIFQRKYTNVEDICFDVHNFMILSKYNLKRNQIKENSASITFVCSCISKKLERKNSGQGGKTSQNSENLEENSENCENFKTNEESLQSNSPDFASPSARGVKRTNIEACKFRLKFSFDSQNKCYRINEDCNITHNHPPAGSKQRMSCEVSL